MSCPLTIFCAAMGQAVRRAIPLVKPDGFEGGRAKDCSITMGRPNRGRKKNIRTEREREREVEGEKQENDCPSARIETISEAARRSVMKEGRKEKGSDKRDGRESRNSQIEQLRTN